MTQLGTRPKIPFPASYHGFHLVRSHGRVYAIPPHLAPKEVQYVGGRSAHPDVLSASSLDQLKAQIDEIGPEPLRPEAVDRCDGYDLVRLRGVVHAVPRSAGPLDLNDADDRRRAGVVSGATPEEVRERLRALGATVPVEFAGWLPIFEYSGNCGRHPQFTHTAEPPPGYRFTYSAPPRRRTPAWKKAYAWLAKGVGKAAWKGWLAVRPFLGALRGAPGVSPRARLRVLAALWRMFVMLRQGGAPLGATLRFLRTRHFQSQLLLGDYEGLVFLTSMPYTYGRNPWVIEIEDPTTLFYPLVQNGQTSDLHLRQAPCYPVIKTLLESDQCRAILTHMRSTARMIATLFESDTIRAKVHYTPLGVKLPDRWQRHEADEEEHLDLLFINSWCQVPENFFVRGGLDVLEAFAVLRERYPQLRLTLRTRLPFLDDHYHRIIEGGWVRVIDRFLPADEMENLLAESHIFLLPAARVHIVSLLQAMSYGLAVVTSDGWGIDEYVTHEHNGLIVKGRYGKVSWADEQVGMLREDYEPMFTSDPEVVEGLVEAVSRLVEDGSLRRRLGRNGRQDVKTVFTPERWNQGLKEALDKALAQAPRDTGRDAPAKVCV